MKTMNFKLFTLLLMATLSLGFVACGGDDDEPTPEPTPTPTPAPEPDPEPEPEPTPVVQGCEGWPADYDGFTLMDLVSYNDKHNEANGEDNRDGENHNNSWNCGWEGECDDPDINRLRHRQVKNAVTLLMVSQGIPMVLSGDEMGNSQQGNDNAYCQDNEIAWLDWNDLERNADIFRYFKRMIQFRRQHKVLRYDEHLRHSDYLGLGYPDFSWHGVKAWQPDTGYNNLTAAFMLNGQYVAPADDFIYVAMNMHWEMHGFELPRLPEGMYWHVFANTGMEAPADIAEPGEEPLTDNQHEVLLGPRSIIILVGRFTSE